MTEPHEPWHEARRAFRRQLLEAGHLIDGGVPGVYGRGGAFEQVIEDFERYITRAGSDQDAEVMRFPPILSRAAYLRTDHIETMPQLMGSVHSFSGNDRDWLELTRKVQAKEPWTDALTPADVMLVPAACYPLYPALRGSLPEGGRTIDLRTFVFRHEPSEDPARMQSFRQREYVRVGTATEALAHRDAWLQRGLDMLLALGLPARAEPANDPFFGRGGRVMKATQREQELKFEVLVPITSEERPTAVISSNCHLDHFGLAYDIRDHTGATAHTACVGFGLERCALALFSVHGMDPARWPAKVRALLAGEEDTAETDQVAAETDQVAAETV